MRFENDFTKQVSDAMTKPPLITAPKGCTLDDAEKIFSTNKVEKLPIVDESGRLEGLITIKDLKREKNIQMQIKIIWSSKSSGRYGRRSA